MQYIDIDEARGRSGLRLVLTAGVPGPWGEAAKAIFRVKGIPFVPVRQTIGVHDETLLAWTRQTSAPVAMYEDERPRSGWAEILFLAEHAFCGRYESAVIRKWLLSFLRRFFSQQWKRSVMPDGPKVGSVSLSPRGDWRMPSDADAAAWLRELEQGGGA